MFKINDCFILLVRQPPTDTSFNTNLKRKMATLLRENDILVLICENEEEMANLSTEVAMTVCTDIESGNLRHIRSLQDFAFDNIHSKTLLLFYYLATNVILFSEEKTFSSNFKKLSSVCNREKNVHGLISIPKTKENEFIFFLNALKTIALKHELQFLPGN